MTNRPTSFSIAEMVGLVPMSMFPVGLLPAKAPPGGLREGFLKTMADWVWNRCPTPG
jgi:hypothetical protein